MREILFRGKRTSDGEWVEGNYCPLETGHFSNAGFIHEIKPVIITKFSTGGYRYHEVIPETVGQYTGLKDKNGKMIFEGDEYKTRVAGEKAYQVVFKSGAYAGGISENYCSPIGWDNNKEEDDLNWIEVIGNIHDVNATGATTGITHMNTNQLDQKDQK